MRQTHFQHLYVGLAQVEIPEIAADQARKEHDSGRQNSLPVRRTVSSVIERPMGILFSSSLTDGSAWSRAFRVANSLGWAFVALVLAGWPFAPSIVSCR